MEDESCELWYATPSRRLSAPRVLLARRATLFNAARTRAVVEKLPEGANFYFARKVSAIACDWSLGMFLEDAAAAAADRSPR